MNWISMFASSSAEAFWTHQNGAMKPEPLGSISVYRVFSATNGGAFKKRTSFQAKPSAETDLALSAAATFALSASSVRKSHASGPKLRAYGGIPGAPPQVVYDNANIIFQMCTSHFIAATSENMEEDQQKQMSNMIAPDTGTTPVCHQRMPK